MSARVLVTIVTYGSGDFLENCLASLEAQTFKDFEIAIWDNDSKDETRPIIEQNKALFKYVHLSPINVGFCAAHNKLILQSESDYILVLNPDVILDPAFIGAIVQEMDRDRRAGSVTGKLQRMPEASNNKEIMLDSTGIYFTPTQRHFDRGSNEIDAGQYQTPEYVFGASGAAAFYRRTMLQDIRVGDQFFDEDFFAYREDADLAWRAQWMGWRCRYEPKALAYHVRKVLPERRASLPDAINMHSFKNRFLMRVKNMDLGTYARFIIPITARDAAILAYALFFERTSLRGLALLLKAFPRAWAARKSLQKRRRVSAIQMQSWFSSHPVSKKII